MKCNPLTGILAQKYEHRNPDDFQCQTLITNIKSMIELHHKMHKDTWIVASGQPGSGKSTVLLYVWKLINDIEGQQANISNDMIKSYKDLLLFLKNTNGIVGKTGFIDEGGVFAPARKSMTFENSELNEVMDVIRIQQKRLFVAAVNLKKLDGAVRTRADVFIRTFLDIRTGQYRFGFYGGSRVNRILQDPRAINSFSDANSFFKVCKPDFYGSIPQIDDQLKTLYEACKTQFQIEFIDEKLRNLEQREQQVNKQPRQAAEPEQPCEWGDDIEPDFSDETLQSFYPEKKIKRAGRPRNRK